MIALKVAFQNSKIEERLKNIGITDSSILLEFDPDEDWEQVLQSDQGINQLALALKLSLTIPKVNKFNAYRFASGQLPKSIDHEASIPREQFVTSLDEFNHISIQVEQSVNESNVYVEPLKGHVDLIRRLGLNVSSDVAFEVEEQFASIEINGGSIEIFGQKVPMFYSQESIESLEQEQTGDTASISLLDLHRGAMIWKSSAIRSSSADYTVEILMSKLINSITFENPLRGKSGTLDLYSLPSSVQSRIGNILQEAIKKGLVSLYFANEASGTISIRWSLGFGDLSEVYLDPIRQDQVILEFPIDIYLDYIYGYSHYHYQDKPSVIDFDIPDINENPGPNYARVLKDMESFRSVYVRPTSGCMIPIGEESAERVEVVRDIESFRNVYVRPSSRSINLKKIKSRTFYKYEIGR